MPHEQLKPITILSQLLLLLLLLSCSSIAFARDSVSPSTVAERRVTTLRQMFEQGGSDGYLRLAYDYTNNAYFTPDKNQRTVTAGGKLGFTTAGLKGFSLRLSLFAQRGIDHSNNPDKVVRALGPDVSALGEAYIQWQARDFRVRAGNQAIDTPFTSTYNFRLIPQLYQGVVARVGDDDRHVTAMRIFRYKRRISNSFDRTTNYNAVYVPYPPNTTETTDGFWALGGTDKERAGSVNIAGKAWFFNYADYANMFYADGEIAQAAGTIKPFLGIQFIRETDDGKALLGEVDHHTYGVQFGAKYGSVTTTLNYDYIPHEKSTFLNGSLVAPYAHTVASGPYFARPLPNSTEDLGSGNAYSIRVEGAPTDRSLLGVGYSFMDLTPQADDASIEQSEYLIFGAYEFGGALKGLSIRENLAFQTSPVYEKDFLTSRFSMQYAF